MAIEQNMKGSFRGSIIMPYFWIADHLLTQPLDL